MGTRFVIVSGFGYSGSSAVSDLLKEYKGYLLIDSEFRIVSDPYGLIQLEKSIVNDWNLIRSSIAANDFLDHCKKSSRRKSHFPLARFGMGYNKYINPLFFDISYDYIKSLSDFTFYGDYYAIKSKKSYFRYVFDRLRHGVEYYSKGKIKLSSRYPLFFIHPSKETFVKNTKNYFDCLFSHFFDENTKTIVLDQALSPNDSHVLNDYFNDAKMIVVKRDPRDVYVNSLGLGDPKRDHLIHSYLQNSEKAGYDFAIKQLALRDHICENDNIALISFEDLVLQYNDTISKIQDFLGLSYLDHVRKGVFFRPDISKENIGVWKKYYYDYKLAIDEIARMMPNDLYSIE